MAAERSETTCCIVGGGPSGMMLGYLLARAGVDVIVLEKHKDFFRDFRGDSVHPSTLEVMAELGLLTDFLRLPHQKLTAGGGVFGDFAFQAARFTRVPTRCKFVALMPQWDFLDFIASRARSFDTFDLRMEHEVIGLLEENGRITGVETRTPEGTAQIRAHLVIGCDGRHSRTRKAGQMEVQEFGVPIDVLWFRISSPSDAPERLLGNFNYGGALILIPRGDYFQAGFLIRKDSFDELKAKGMDAFRSTMLKLAPFLGKRVEELQSWDEVKLLSVRINRLRRWFRPGLLCIGDAAHAMSPVGGVGINLAIQDSVATANLLATALRSHAVTDSLLARVQKRREFPARVTQFVQKNAHKVMDRVFQNKGPLKAPWQLRAAVRIPGVQSALGFAIGVGVRPEHIAGSRSQNRLRRLLLGGFAAAGCAFGAAVAVKQIRNRALG